MAEQPHLLIDDLRDLVKKRQLVAVVGSGVSIQASGNPGVASWLGLLRDGVQRCLELALVNDEWSMRRSGDLDSGDPDELLGVAENVTKKLKSASLGEYSRWLRETVGQLHVSYPDVLNGLAALDVPLTTTNYDLLIEEATGLDGVTWQEPQRVERVLRGDERGVIHWHGRWDQPESVVLGLRSYDEVLQNAHAQAVMRSLRMSHSLLFVGFGDGLRDPNWGAFLEWTRAVFAESEYRHYRLMRSSEVKDGQRVHHPDERIFVLPYGDRHSDLAPCLRSLRHTGSEGRRSFGECSPTTESGEQGDSKEAEHLVGIVGDVQPPRPTLAIYPRFMHDQSAAGESGAVQFVVENLGDVPAVDIQVQFEDPLVDTQGIEVSARPPISRPIPVLKPGMDVRVHVDDYYELQLDWMIRAVRGEYGVKVVAKNPRTGAVETSHFRVDLGTVFPAERVGPWIDEITQQPVVRSREQLFGPWEVDPHPDNLAPSSQRNTAPGDDD